MRRTARLLAATALAVTAAGGGLAAPAYGGGTPATDGAPRVTPGAGVPPSGALEVAPRTVAPGTHVTATTDVCGDNGAADGDASAVGAGRFTLAPTTDEGRALGQFKVPESAVPGTYEIVAKCAKSGRQALGDLVVALGPAHGAAAVHPRGSVKTGVGGALGPDPVQTAAGVAALAVAAAGGTWLLHRRARGDGM
ncbi:hypothetical protein ABZX40_17730 [Streptomyces sp. NPDC004610]|uniref:hypothetical protein n=1 Tax=unclassified Streptomyces TaxID=2593676 RepID=UPI0033ABAB9A